MTREERIGIVTDIIYLLREKCDQDEALRILSNCTSFYLHAVSKDKRRDEFERWVQHLYEMEFKLEARFNDDYPPKLQN